MTIPFIITTLLCSVAVAAPQLSKVEGKLNGATIALQIATEGDETRIFGNLDTNETNFRVISMRKKSQVEGLIRGQPIRYGVVVDDRFADFVGMFNNKPLNLNIENRDYATWFRGTIDGSNLSTKIDRTRKGKSIIGGFYRRDLADLVIDGKEESRAFTGYINGHWASFNLTTAKMGVFRMEGQLHGQDIELEGQLKNFELANLIELLFFDIYAPNFKIIHL